MTGGVCVLDETNHASTQTSPPRIGVLTAGSSGSCHFQPYRLPLQAWVQTFSARLTAQQRSTFSSGDNVIVAVKSFLLAPGYLTQLHDCKQQDWSDVRSSWRNKISRSSKRKLFSLHHSGYSQSYSFYTQQLIMNDLGGVLRHTSEALQCVPWQQLSPGKQMTFVDAHDTASSSWHIRSMYIIPVTRLPAVVSGKLCLQLDLA